MSLRVKFRKILKDQTYPIQIWPKENTVDALLAVVCEEFGHIDKEIELGGGLTTDPYSELLCERCGRRE